MRLLFCYSAKGRIDKNNNIYPKTFTDELLKRYYYLADDITMFGRYYLCEENLNEYYISLNDRNNYRIINIPNIYSLKGILFFNRKVWKQVEDEVKKADIVIIRVPDMLGDRALKFCNKYNKKYIVEMGGCSWDSMWNYNLKGKLLAPIRFLKTRITVKNSNNVIYVTNNFLQKRYPTYGNSIGCSDVCLEKIDSMNLKNRINKIKNMDMNKKIVIGTCAAIDVKYKGQEYVIKALSALKNKGFTNFEYQLVGGGSPERLLKIAKKFKVEDKIKIVGSISHDKVFKWLDSIDIYIQPSNQEGLPRAVVEAMSRGCPCIVSNTGGNPELIEKKYVFKRKKYKLLEKCLTNICNKKELIDQATKNFEKSKEYDADLLDKKRKEFYDSIME